MPQERFAASGAAYIAAVLRSAVASRGRATMALSGGSAVGPMFEALARADVPWSEIDVVQVDERVAPEGHQDRNLSTLRESLLDRVPMPADRLHPMPVSASDLERAAESYANVLHHLAGSPVRLDLVHLGLGTDGHTASLVPGSAIVAETSRPVAVTAAYGGRRRMTLTPQVLSDARRVLWVVSGGAKAAMVRRLVDRDPTIPAAWIEQSCAHLLLDPSAAAKLSPTTPAEGL